jgi:predicted nuclease of predicted toxin-antitoxin system
VKLLFDENLSHRLVDDVRDLYPDSDHVRTLGLQRVSDADVWNFARAQGFTIVTKDADFHERSLLNGHPPKVIWIRRGNCSTAMIADILRANHTTIVSFEREEAFAALMLY